jgi:hypothetical protein
MVAMKCAGDGSNISSVDGGDEPLQAQQSVEVNGQMDGLKK